MFDIGWTEMLVIAVVAIVVVGPRDLPKLLRALGGMVRQGRKLAREFQDGVEDFMREAELDEVKKSIHHVSNFDPRNQPDFLEDPTGGKKSRPDVPDRAETKTADRTTADSKGDIKDEIKDDGKGDGA